MNASFFIPSSLREAGQKLRIGLQSPAANLSKRDFVNAWSSIAYLFPGLHPDGFNEPDSGWPRVLKCFAAEAWRRAEARELDDEELFASDAQWAGIYDRMTVHTVEETARRKHLSLLR
jgi:hypothetical protein